MFWFCPWKYEKMIFKSRMLKQNWRNFPLLPWLPKIANPFNKFGYSTISLCISDWNLPISNMMLSPRVYSHYIGSSARAEWMTFLPSKLQDILTYETIIYLKWNDIFFGTFWCIKKIYDNFENVFLCKPDWWFTEQ